jgi:TRAP-type C4-dicarboxylate transport system permease small subunit
LVEDKAMKTLDRVIVKTILATSIFSFWVIFILVFYTVIVRFFELSSIAWMDDIIHVGIVWMVFMGSALCLRNNEHVRADMVNNLLKRKWPKIAKSLDLINLLLILFYLVYLLKASWELVTKILRTAWLPSLPIVKSWWMSPILASCILMIAYTIAHIVGIFRGDKRFLFSDLQDKREK